MINHMGIMEGKILDLCGEPKIIKSEEHLQCGKNIIFTSLHSAKCNSMHCSCKKWLNCIQPAILQKQTKNIDHDKIRDTQKQ